MKTSFSPFFSPSIIKVGTTIKKRLAYLGARPLRKPGTLDEAVIAFLLWFFSYTDFSDDSSHVLGMELTE